MSRTARKPDPGEVEQAGRGNGDQGSEAVDMHADALAKSQNRKDPATGKDLDMSEENREGNRETVPPGEADKIWTADSKDRWGTNADGSTPTQQELLSEQRKTEAKRRKKED